MARKGVIPGEFKVLKISDLVEFEGNPNEMDEATFNRLAAELDNIGLIDPVIVVPLEDGRFRIIGGHQRVAAAKALGWEEITAVVLTDERFKDEDLLKLICVRLNVLKGKINPEKFINLYNEMAEKYGEEALQQLFAVMDEEEWGRLTHSIKKTLQKAGIPADLVNKLDEVRELKTVDDLSLVLNEIFTKYGYQLQSDFLVFNYPKSSKKILYIEADKDVFSFFESNCQKCVEMGISVNDFLKELIKVYQSKSV